MRIKDTSYVFENGNMDDTLLKEELAGFQAVMDVILQYTLKPFESLSISGPDVLF